MQDLELEEKVVAASGKKTRSRSKEGIAAASQIPSEKKLIPKSIKGLTSKYGKMTDAASGKTTISRSKAAAAVEENFRTCDRIVNNNIGPGIVRRKLQPNELKDELLRKVIDFALLKHNEEYPDDKVVLVKVVKAVDVFAAGNKYEFVIDVPSETKTDDAGSHLESRLKGTACLQPWKPSGGYSRLLRRAAAAAADDDNDASFSQ